MRYTKEEFEEFAGGIKKASDILRSRKPDYVFAPLLGSVPLVDLLAITDRHFNLDNVEYPPNSSRFLDREGIMQGWYGNFLSTNYHGEDMKIVCVDEVISGSSAVKGYQEFQKALFEFARKSGQDAKKKVSYEILGIGEKPKNGKRNHGLERLTNSGIAKVIEVGRILTSDDPVLNPVRLKIGGTNPQGRQIYLPEVERFDVTEDYITLLQNFAADIGADPSKVSPQNLAKIRDSALKYLSKV